MIELIKKMKMKKLITVTLLALLLFSCKKVEDLLTFTVNDQSEVTIESNILPFTLPHEIWLPPITTNSEEEFKNNNTSSSLVKNIYLTHLDISIKSPTGKTFSFLKSMTLYISLDGENEIVLAKKENIDSNANVLNMEVTSSRLDTYVKADSYKLRTEVTLRETLTQDVTVGVDMSYKVTADPL